MIRTYTQQALLATCFTILFFSCTASKKSAVTPALYNTYFEVQYRLEHQSSDSTSLFLSVQSNDYELTYKAYSLANSNIILAEETVYITEKKDQVAERTFLVREPAFYLEIFVKDQEENRVFRDWIKVDKSKSAAFIQIRSDDTPIIRTYLDLGTEIVVSHPNADQLWVKYFSKAFKAATPPFSDKGYKFNPRRDISQLVPIPNGGTIKLEGEGLYFIQSDTSSLDGIYINVFDERFPRISSAEEMVESTRYIMKRDEYRSAYDAENPKDAVEKFWMSRAKDQDFAKKLIKTYYTRVQIANRDFTTYKEGWKTDRGMLYIIFGPPNQIKKKAEGEIWTYHSSGKRNSVRFQFNKIHGQSLLSRLEYFKRPWDVEVYEWRTGILNE